MKKLTITLLAISTLLFVGACGNNDTTSEKTKEKSKTEQVTKAETSKEVKTVDKKTEKATDHITKTVNNIDMKVGNIKTTASATEGKNMVSIEMTFLNNDNGPVGVGAVDFIIKSGGKTYKVYPPGNNFGDEFKPNETLKGKAYFELPTTVKDGVLYYAPMDKEKANWSIVIPEAQ
ncbi:hypothetical protein HCB25_01475 [Listeria booriae]|uniref:DUF4352 domain-containing protein n=1 Tax=Listeria booriae TaxID=1552123 RepID=A0A842F5W9_9LIST|nr:hypothetical protein [Listeria booriae]MBC2242715.1 hypothetical protein [Listeria booriae]